MKPLSNYRTINFLYFIHNFSQDALWECIGATSMPDHNKNMLMERHAQTGSMVMRASTIIDWFMNLSHDNMDAFLTKMNEIYDSWPQYNPNPIKTNA